MDKNSNKKAQQGTLNMPSVLGVYQNNLIIGFLILFIFIISCIIILKVDVSYDMIKSLAELVMNTIISIAVLCFTVSTLYAPKSQLDKIYKNNLSIYVSTILMIISFCIVIYVLCILGFECIFMKKVLFIVEIISLVMTITRTLVFLLANFDLDGRNSN